MNINTFTPATGNVLEDNCSGRNPDIQGQTLYDYYTANQCRQRFKNTLFTLDDGTVGYNPAQLDRVSANLQNLYSTYLQNNYLVFPGQVGYNTFQDVLALTCRDLPTACAPVLKSLCTGCSRDSIAGNSINLEFCGCYAPPTGLTTLPPVCDPLCTRIDTLPLGSSTTGEPIQCNVPVCVIDSVSITATRSSVGGSVSFNQVCNMCDGGSCRCIVSGVNVSGLLNSIGVGAQFNQLCGMGSTCFQVDPVSQISTPVDCVVAPPPVVATFPWWIFGIVGFVILVIIMIIVISR